MICSKVMDFKSGCLICGKELVYKNNNQTLSCFYCGNTFSANAECVDGHYVCDQCHSSSANDIIEKYCISTNLKDPIELAISLMKHPSIKMHGPEHHFLVPAVLLSAFYNKQSNFKEKETKIKQARQRAEKILGGFCGSHGNCGAAVGTGIYISLIMNATPLSKEEWKQSNMITAKTLLEIAKLGGPRCCKRNSLLAIKEALKYLNMESKKNIKCEFSDFNKECLKEKCLFKKEG